ncbi:hypothetical protein CBS115989_6291 [Aspergillus niger]|uniref:Contig An11c0150, genomic contig n=4 Tax=Aspergillus niger TaxID=5061 RepID=A2QW07_ASPNC|nr:uncharacterized protein An11g03390 [Aspergillus niger]RDH21391.1 DUF500-domain-containing protein [Aspergillus niger ATCC 13496]KAI2816994.1 hypothetical protein CBS115989_6291 [Aspergillus niger]KAI2833211.1 hypothetical protein CBS133816_576 [Aspergillus niger]KAI2854389.1 hypothetical protein CBS11232_4979 [Aspergillus niger]KAI2861597.1 hypothetical protein CBS12448_4737 [Aspergillus niger]|eukprot:XP_001394340.1 hypothetical protein ANI_1_1812094 [Aspergillus niger CBS 513.88]
MPVHNPFPSSLRSECDKAAQIINSFTDPDAFNSPGRTIPRKVLASAKGLAILTVAKAAFLGSVRLGSGILVARLPDGSWSAPSAIASVGGGFGGQIGVELTDFVFILQSDHAVQTFAKLGSLTLGLNLSLAVGPVGRSGEIASVASTGGVMGIFSFAQTRGLFGGVSAELGMIIENRLVNRKLYGDIVKAQELLSGDIPPPDEANRLMQALQADVFHAPRTNIDCEQAPKEPPAEVTVAMPPQSPSSEVAERVAAVSPVTPSEVHEAPTSELFSAGSPSIAVTPQTPVELPGSVQELDSTPAQPKPTGQHSPVSAISTTHNT